MAHQMLYGAAINQAFKAKGFHSEITANPNTDADIHVLVGPYYAKKQWIGHPATILVDRCYYRGDPDFVSMGWMTSTGGRKWFLGEGREPPEIKEKKNKSEKSIYLADYCSREHVATDAVRYHPSDVRFPRGERSRSLVEALEPFGYAVGYETTALAIAALEGLTIECRGAFNVMARENWRELLPYIDWGIDEMPEAIDFLLEAGPGTFSTKAKT